MKRATRHFMNGYGRAWKHTPCLLYTSAKALIDIDTTEVTHYADAPAWKKTQNINDKAEILCWPLFGLGDYVFHASVHTAARMTATDSDNGGCPAESPSNKSLQIDR